MPKVLKYGDVSGVESDFTPAPVGLYVAKVTAIEQKNSKNTNEPMFEVIFQITKDADGKKIKKTYGQLWYYAPTTAEGVHPGYARRLKELVSAFGLKLKGGNIAVIVNKECLIKLKEDSDLEGEYRPAISKLLKWDKDADVEDEADEDEVEEDEDEDEEEVEEDDGNLDELTRNELKLLIKSEELDIRVVKSMSDDDIREAIKEQMGEEDDEEEEDEEEEEDIEEEDEDEEEAEDDNYDSMSVAALRQELKDRELDSTGKQAVLVARLRTDDAEEPV